MQLARNSEIRCSLAALDQTNVEVRQVSVAVPAVSQAVVLHDDQI